MRSIYLTLSSFTIKLLIVYIIAVNIFAFLVYWHDKRMAQQNIWRIPESFLFALSLVGGSVGSLAGMYVFRHKTKKDKFKYGIPIIIVMQLLLLIAVLS